MLKMDKQTEEKPFTEGRKNVFSSNFDTKFYYQ